MNMVTVVSHTDRMAMAVARTGLATAIRQVVAHKGHHLTMAAPRAGGHKSRVAMTEGIPLVVPTIQHTMRTSRWRAVISHSRLTRRSKSLRILGLRSSVWPRAEYPHTF